MSKPIHFVGIGGIGMSALAKVLLERGWAITGSDIASSALTDGLARLGATVYTRHAVDNLGDAGLVVTSSAVPPDNVEVLKALSAGIPVIKRAELLGRIMAEGDGIAVAGTHGKTSTSAMISVILERAGLDPTVLIGGESLDLGTNAKSGLGPHVVAEADEYDGSFLRLKPRVAVVTNIEADHLDFFGSVDAVRQAFRQFLAGVSPVGYIVACADSPEAMSLVHGAGGPAACVQTYSVVGPADWQAVNVKPLREWGHQFDVVRQGVPAIAAQVRRPGLHNVSNGLAALAAASHAGVAPDAAVSALAEFRGVKRRFELKGEIRGVTVVDDYAHHPTEILATLAAARGVQGGRVVALFQPHTRHRTLALLGDFAAAFGCADVVGVMDIYLPAGREGEPESVRAQDLVGRMAHPHAAYVGSGGAPLAWLKGVLRRGDLLLTLGAGDVFRVGERLLETW